MNKRYLKITGFGIIAIILIGFLLPTIAATKPDKKIKLITMQWFENEKLLVIWHEDEDGNWYFNVYKPAGYMSSKLIYSKIILAPPQNNTK